MPLEHEVVLATCNEGKVREYARMLDGLPVRLRSLSDLPGYEPPPEDGETFSDNARLKAAAAAAAAGLPAIADDSGLCVAALGGAPGVHSARYAGAEATDSDRRRALLAAMLQSREGSRAATFECVIAVALPSGQVATVSGRCRGHILEEERGEDGFGYDPLFVPAGHAKTFAEMAAEEKDALSHRGRAAARLPGVLQRLLPALATPRPLV